MKKLFLLFLIGFLISCKTSSIRKNEQNLKVVAPKLKTELDPKVKTVQFEGYTIELKSKKINQDFDSMGFTWRDPEAKEYDECLEIDEIAERTFCYYKPYSYTSKRFISEKGDISSQKAVPVFLEFYSNSNELVKKIDIYANNPYKKSIISNLNKEFYFDAEVGFAPELARELAVKKDKADSFWTSTSVCETSEKYGYVAIIYELTGLNEDGAILYNKSTSVILDKEGNTIIKLNNMQENPYGVLVTKDKNYTIINVGGDLNLNNMKERLSKNAIIFYDNKTKNEIYRETKESNFSEFGIVGEKNGLVSTSFVSYSDKKANPDYYEDRYVYDMEKRICY